MQIHNMDLCDEIKSIEFKSAKEAIQHLKECGYWSQPISFGDPDMDDYFYSCYRAADWSTDGHIHYTQR